MHLVMRLRVVVSNYCWLQCSGSWRQWKLEASTWRLMIRMRIPLDSSFWRVLQGYRVKINCMSLWSALCVKDLQSLQVRESLNHRTLWIWVPDDTQFLNPKEKKLNLTSIPRAICGSSPFARPVLRCIEIQLSNPLWSVLMPIPWGVAGETKIICRYSLQ